MQPTSLSRRSLSYVASGPGPAGEPTPLGDPSIPNLYGGSLLAEEALDEGGIAVGLAAPLPARAEEGEPRARDDSGGAAAEAAGPGPGSARAALAAAGGGGGPELRLSVLNVDGSVVEGGGVAALLSRVLTGELEAAVTGECWPADIEAHMGSYRWVPPYVCLLALHARVLHPGKGFSWLLQSQDAQLLLPLLQRGAVFARMSPDNKRDLMLLLGAGIDGAEVRLTIVPDACQLSSKPALSGARLGGVCCTSLRSYCVSFSAASPRPQN